MSLEAATFTNFINTLNNINLAIANLNKTINAVFPQFIGTATTATGGAETLPANPVGFLTVVNPVTGTTVKIPYYS